MTGAAFAGALRFGRYALPPNTRGYCGPDDAAELAGALGESDAATVALLAPAFTAAYPYLALIAASAGIADPLDARVVAAYWLGGPLAAAVPPGLLAAHLEERFGALAGRFRPALGEAVLAGGIACHSLHVLAATPFGALVRSGAAGAALEVCDRCRIRPARIVALSPGGAVVAVRPLALSGGLLVLGSERHEQVHAAPEQLRPGALAPGDVVALHWDWVCERLDPASAAALRRSDAANRAAVSAAAHPPPLVAAEALGG